MTLEPGSAALAGLLLGLSSGPTCFWSCAAVMAPYLVATDTSRLETRWGSVPAALRAVGWYNLGRLLAYLAAGGVAALVAGAGGLPPAAEAAALAGTAALLFAAVFRRPSRAGCLRAARQRDAGAFTLGLLQGLTPCPPFLAALGLALAAPGPLVALSLFAALFLGTALYTLPLAFLEPLRRSRWLAWGTRALGLLVALYLVVRAGLLLHRA